MRWYGDPQQKFIWYNHANAMGTNAVALISASYLYHGTGFFNNFDVGIDGELIWNEQSAY